MRIGLLFLVLTSSCATAVHEPAEARLRLDEPRIRPIALSEATPQQRAYLEPYAQRDLLFNVFKTAAHHPDFASSFDAYAFGHINGETSTLTARQRELLILRIGWLCRSEYEWAQHSRVALSIGMTEPELARIIDGPDAPEWDPLESALLRAADELHRDAFVSDATWSALEAHLDTRQLFDVIATVGTYNLACMLLNSLGVQLDEGLTGFPG